MIRGETVTLLTPTITYDERKDATKTYAQSTVENVLFATPTTDQIDADMRAFGVFTSYILHFPQDFTASLRGCKVYRPRDERTYEVIGDPQPYPPELCPTSWNREAHVRWIDG